MPKYILQFSQIDKESTPEAGGKGANLGEMTQAGFPVPPGFVVTAAAYKLFLEENNLEGQIRQILKASHARQPQQYQQASEKITRIMRQGKIPDVVGEEVVQNYRKLGSVLRRAPVAVRSSATAGDLQATFLNIKGEKQLLEAVRDCWASLFTARAIFYREEKSLGHSKVALAVVVQKMIQPEVSGIAFTADPITADKHKVVIEAVWGLGEFAGHGIVTPDRYEVERHDLQILKIEKHPQDVQLIKVGGGNKQRRVPAHRQNRQKLSEDKIKELTRILQKIHIHYFFPQDVEWAYTGGKFYIIQARPITTLGERGKGKGESKEEYGKTSLLPVLTGQGASPGIVTGVVKIVSGPKQLSKVKKGDILVTHMSSPDYIPAMKLAAAAVTDEGGITSHAAIVSRELGMPCVVGTKQATKKLKDGDVVTVDGKAGLVYKGKASNVSNVSNVKKEVEPDRDIRTATKIYVNLAEPERAAQVAQLPVDGVGLLRAEFMVAQIGKHPKHLLAQGRQHEFIDGLAQGLFTFCQAFDGRPVVYRTTDFKTNEYRNLAGGGDYEPEEPNPMLGFRGAFRYIADPDVFELELAAIKKVRAQHKNLWVMIPFVRSPQELLQTKRIMAASGLVRSPTFKLWLMVELPVNVVLIDDFIKVGIDGVSIGSNDLTMLTLGTDRDNSQVAGEYNETNPAVLQLLRKTIKACQKADITSSICGQAPSTYDSLVEFLVKEGITSISANPDAVGRVQRVVYDVERNI